MTKTESAHLREQLLHALRGDQSHITFASAVAGFPPDKLGAKPAGAPHSAWQLLEHLRIAQHDILEFSRNPKYKSPKWPEEYWPESEAPPDAQAWDATVKAFQRDARALEKLVKDEEQDLWKRLEHGEGQTLLREVLTASAHHSYHLGQLVFLKKMLLLPTAA